MTNITNFGLAPSPPQIVINEVGSGTVAQITSVTLTITNPSGPTVDIELPAGVPFVSLGGAGETTLGGEVATLDATSTPRNVLDDGVGNSTFGTVTAGSGAFTTLTLSGILNVADNLKWGTQSTQTTTYAMLETDFAVYADATAGAFNVTLNHTLANTGIIQLVKKIDSTANAITVLPGSGTIDGASSYTLSSQWNSILVQRHSSSTWYILATH